MDHNHHLKGGCSMLLELVKELTLDLANGTAGSESDVISRSPDITFQVTVVSSPRLRTSQEDCREYLMGLGGV